MPRTDLEPSTFYDQHWDAFDNIYIDFALEYTQQLFTHELSLKVFESFPINLPPGLIIPIMAKRYAIHEDERIRRKLPPNDDVEVPEGFDEFAREVAKEELDEFQERVWKLFEGVYALSRWGKKMDYTEFPDFERVLLTQHVITVCSFAEGFCANVLRFFAKKPPFPFSAWKKANIQRKKIRRSSEDELFEAYLYEMGKGDLISKIKVFEKSHGTTFSFAAPHEGSVKDLFLLRNHLVHNSGRASELLMKKSTRWSTIQNDQEIPMDPSGVEEMVDDLVDVVAEIYRACSLQLLGKQATQLMFGPHRV